MVDGFVNCLQTGRLELLLDPPFKVIAFLRSNERGVQMFLEGKPTNGMSFPARNRRMGH